MEDLQIWKRLKEGDKAALALIYDTHFDYLYHYSKRLSRNRALIEDAIQDLFLELWNNRNGLSNTDSIKKYLTVSIRRKVILLLKRRQKTQLQNDDVIFESDFELSIDTIIENREISKEQSQKLKLAFENLSERQKEAIYLKYYQGYDYEDIQQIMGINYQSIRNLVAKGIQNISKQLKNITQIIFFCMSTNGI